MSEKKETKWADFAKEQAAAKKEAAEAGDELGTVDELDAELDVQSVDVDPKELASQLEEARNEAKQHWDMLLRTQAEMQNYKNRMEKDLSNAHKFALEKFTKELLPVVDSLEQALAAEEDGSNHGGMEGVKLTLDMLLKALAKHGVEQIDPMGQAFDPQLHEAMSMQPSPEQQDNTVMAVFQKGFTLNGRLIRPARVVVVKN